MERVAAQVGAEDLGADLVLAMDRGHEKALRKLVDDPSRVRLLRSFDPAATGDLDVPDPYYGGSDGFEEVLDMIEAATPGLLAWVREAPRRMSARPSAAGPGERPEDAAARLTGCPVGAGRRCREASRRRCSAAGRCPAPMRRPAAGPP